MASGKQTSFKYGELSPSQRFKATTVHFNEGLAKLRNAYVLRDGGISNRSGFQFMGTPTHQYDVDSHRKIPRIKTLEYENTEFTVVDDENYTKFLINGMEPSLELYVDAQTFTGGKITPPTANNVVMIPTKDGVFIPNCQLRGFPITNIFVGSVYLEINPNFDPVDLIVTSSGKVHVSQRGEVLVMELLVGGGFTGKAPFLPVSYLVTATLTNGREVIVNAQNSTGFSSNPNGDANPSGNFLLMPHAQMRTFVSVEFENSGEIQHVRFFNLYRASGDKGERQSFFKLAARIPCDTNTLKYSISDFGAEDPYTTPPIDYRYYPEQYLMGGHPRPPLYGTSVGVYYQQRLIVAGNHGDLKRSEVLVSAIGAPLQFAQPIISNNLGSFTFSLPIEDGSRITGMLSMERLLIGSLKGVYIVRGGENAVLTPSTVNPVKISDEGWNSEVEATMSGNRGFWINASGTKLMYAQFGDDGNVGLGEASILSNHLLKGGITQMVSINDRENSLYLLNRKGQIIRATVGVEPGVFGFSLYETKGFVESIYRTIDTQHFPDGSGRITTEVLGAYVIRNGVRHKEIISIRNDEFNQLELFADMSLRVGSWLSLDPSGIGSPGYLKSWGYRIWNTWSSIDLFGLKINIEDGAHSWGAYENITISSNIPLPSVLSDQTFALHFYYDLKDDNGDLVLDRNGRPKTRFIRYIPDGNPAVFTKTQSYDFRGIRIKSKDPMQYSFAFRLYDPDLVGGPAVTPGNEQVDSLDDGEITIGVSYNGSTVQNIYNLLTANATFNSLFTVEIIGADLGAITGYLYDFSSVDGNGLGFQISGQFESDVPEELRDVAARFDEDDIELHLLQTRWLPAFNRIRESKLASYPLLGALVRSADNREIVVVTEGGIVSSPLNPNLPTMTIQEDADDYFIDFGDFISYAYIGLPYTSEIETLDIEAGDNRTLTDSRKLINAVGVGVMETRGGFFGVPGRPLEEMEELRVREDGDMFAPTVNKSGYVSVTIPGEWTEAGRVNIKNVDPVPMTILSVYPKGISGD